MPARITDWAIAGAIGVAFTSGIISLVSGRPEQWLVFVVHGVAGISLLLLLPLKLRRVLPRLLRRSTWDRATILGIGSTLIVLLTIASGVWWVSGGEWRLLGYNALNWHILLGLVLTLIVSLHMIARARPLPRRDLRNRRKLARLGGLTLVAALLWPAQQAVGRSLDLPGSRRRFTGSREAGSYTGNAFPTTSWVADRPRPIDPQHWRLEVSGAVARPLELRLADLEAADVLDATLDCTGGFYSAQIWRGVRVGRVLERSGVSEDAGWVSFISITGYRWSLPIAEAARALLATHVGDELISHSHGAPMRLVAPGRRGFEWVKWVVAIEVRTTPDPGQLLSIYTSSFTDAGRGRI